VERWEERPLHCTASIQVFSENINIFEVIPIKKKDYGTGIPQHEITALARCLLPEIQKFFETEEGKREYEEWKALQATIKQSQKKSK